MARNQYSKEFEDDIRQLAKEQTLDNLLSFAKEWYHYNITKGDLRQYLSKRKIRYKDYNKNMAHPNNDLPIGSEYIKPDGMAMIKTEKGTWEYKQRYIYEKYYNIKLNTDTMVIFLDRNKHNFNINNLIAVKSKEYNYCKNKGLLTNDPEENMNQLMEARNYYKKGENDMKFWEKKISNAKDLANKLGVDDEKIKNLKEGKIEIGGETMDKVLNAIEETNSVEHKFKKLDYYNWVMNTDINQKMHEFNIKNQTELAEKAGIQRSDISRMINKSNQLSPNYTCFEKMYKFFNDELNKQPLVVQKESKKRTHEINSELAKFYKEFDLEKYMIEKNMKRVELAKEIGVAWDTINCFITKEHALSNVSLAKIKYYVENNPIVPNPPEEPEEKITISEPIDKITISEPINEETYTLEISKEANGIKYFINNETTNEIDYKSLYEHAEETMAKMLEENRQLKAQVSRYEKLIDRL